MRPKTCIRLVAASAFVVFALSVTVSPVRGDPAEDTQEKPSAEAEPILSPEEHYAKGEAEYDGAWMPIQKLFEMYVRERDQLRYIRQHGSAEQEQLQKLHREIALIRGEARQEQQPVRRELAKARNELRECNRILHLSPPSKPQLQRLPSPPRRPASGYDSDYDSSSGWYDKARRDWERQCEAIRRQNKVRMEQYQRELQAYQKKQNDAKQAVPKLEAKIKECMKELGEIEDEYEKKGAPTLRRSDQVTDRVRAHNRRVEVIEARVEAMTKALLAVPEPIRHKHGIRPRSTASARNSRATARRRISPSPRTGATRSRTVWTRSRRCWRPSRRPAEKRADPGRRPQRQGLTCQPNGAATALKGQAEPALIFE